MCSKCSHEILSNTFSDATLKLEIDHSEVICNKYYKSNPSPSCPLEPVIKHLLAHHYKMFEDFPSGSAGKESACNAGDGGSIPGSGRSHGGGNGNPLQDNCRGNPMDRGAWLATVHRVTKSKCSGWI